MRSCPPAPDPTRLGGSARRRPTRLRGGRWRLGHRPEEFRSLGRLSASELCSLPMVQAATGSGQRGGGHRAGCRATGKDANGTGMLHPVGAPQGALCAQGMPSPRRGARGGEWEAPSWGTDALRGAARPHAARPPPLEEFQGARGWERRAAAAPATCGRRRFHSLAHAPQARSFRDADWRRRRRAAVSSGLQGRRFPPQDRRDDSRKTLR